MDFETRYAKLNTAQKLAVDTIDGPVMVVAGPGTGKTELLSMRTASILKKTDTLPSNILCLTFTDSGAAAMRERLTQIIGQDAYKVAIHTFHSFGSEIINQNSEFFYNGAVFEPADELSNYEVIKSIFDELEYTNPLASKMNGDYTYLKDTLTAISELKRSGLASSELLAVLDANDVVFDTFEKQLASIFSSRISATTLSFLVPIAHEIAAHPESPLPPEVSSFSSVLAMSLAHAVDQAQETDSTKPITKWKNQWFEKDSIGQFVFKSRKKQLKLRTVAAIYDSYLSRMQESELFDFDDMILRVVHAMETQPDLRFNLQEKYQYIMVDEFQDTNMAQARILHDLSSSEINEGKPNILVVGDDDQAIYAFQGADVSNILNFQATYPSAVQITLTDNYRSVAPVLEAARAVIVQGSDRLEGYIDDLDKTLTPHKNSSSEITLLHTGSKDEERHQIISRIQSQLKKGIKPESIVVLARRHHELIALLPYFADANIIVSYEKRDNVLESDIIQLLETVARIVLALGAKQHHEVDSLLPQLLAHPAWQFSPEDIWKLSLAAYSNRKMWMEILAVTPEFVKLHNWLLKSAVLSSSTPLERMLDILIGNNESLTSEDFKAPFFDYFFSQDKITSEPDKYITYLEALRTIRGKLREYQPDEPPTLDSFISFIELHRSTNTPITSVRRKNSDTSGAVNLMTAHKSKGQEFETVYIVGAVDNAWGEKVRSRSRLIGYPENLPLAPSGTTFDERLRLFFVAMTRAKNNLIMSYSSHDENDKETLKASFLVPLAVPEIHIDEDVSFNALQISAEREWYAPLVSPLTSSLKDVLGSTLDQYKLSATHLNNFLDVSRGGPQHFLLANLLRFPSAMSPFAAYGSAIHATLQQAHNNIKVTNSQRPQEDIIHDFEQQLKEKFLTPEEFNMFLQKGGESLRAFLAAKYDSFNASQKVELSFSHQQVRLGEARLTGALDLVEIDDDRKTMTVTDYKTGKATSTWQGKTDYEKIKLHRYKQQLMFYKLLVENSRDFDTHTVDKGIIQFVEPTQNGDILALDLAFDTDELAEFSQLVQIVWKRITSLDLPDSSHYEPSYSGILAFEAALLENN